MFGDHSKCKERIKALEDALALEKRAKHKLESDYSLLMQKLIAASLRKKKRDGGTEVRKEDHPAAGG